MISIYPMNPIGVMSGLLWLICTVFLSACSIPPDSHTASATATNDWSVTDWDSGKLPL